MEPNFLSQRDVARLFGVSVRTVHRWRQSRTFPKPLLVGSVVRFLEEDVLAWAEENREDKPCDVCGANHAQCPECE